MEKFNCYEIHAAKTMRADCEKQCPKCEREEILRKSRAYDITPMMKEELDEAAEKYCFTSFKWPLNKDGEKESIPPGQTVPHGFSKYSKLVKKAFIQGALWQSKRYE